MWKVTTVRPENIELGRGWHVRRSLIAGKQRVPVEWTWPIVDRRTASDVEMRKARLSTPGWPDRDHPGYASAIVLIGRSVLGETAEYVFPQGVTLSGQRLRTPY